MSGHSHSLGQIRGSYEGFLPLNPRWVVDADFKKRYDEITSGRPDGRGFALCCRIEESPHSAERDAGQPPERGNLLDRATETNYQATGKGEKAV